MAMQQAYDLSQARQKVDLENVKEVAFDGRAA